ncbi:MAG TPA: Amuc_1100 family pilus-like protein [Luteolibacter sp.]
MSWIKENPFVVTLGGITLVGAAGLLFAGSHFGSKYQATLEAYQADAEEVARGEQMALYPKQENLDAKNKAIADYRDAISKLQNNFGKYRPAELKNISSQEFTDHLRDADSKIRAAFADSGVHIPDAFFAGFATYRGTLARDNATGVLDYQLGAATELFLALAKAAPAELKNVYRPKLVEEDGGKFEAGDALYRSMPIEVTFRGSEKSVRAFLSALASSGSHYYVVRAFRADNDRLTGPGPADVKFEEAAPAASSSPGDAFGGAFGAVEAAPGTSPAADTSRKLIQIAGGEQINIFLRIDILQFLPAKELPKS